MVRKRVFRIFEIWSKFDIPFKDSGLCGNEVNVFGYKFNNISQHETRTQGYIIKDIYM